jgi:flagellar motor switch protein FliM
MAGPGARSQIGRDSLAELFTGSSTFVQRLPMLRVAFERAAEACAEDLASISTVPPQVVLQRLESGTAGDLLGAQNGNSAICILHASAWNARLVAIADRNAVFAIVEMMLGGDGSQPAPAVSRPLSLVERRVAATLFERVARALETGFAGIADTPFAVEASAESIDFDVFAGANNAIVAAVLRLEMAGMSGDLIIAVARAAINPLRQVLGRVPVKEEPAADPQWSQQMQNEITRAHVTLTAVLDERMGLMGEVANFKVGQVVELNATAHGRLRLECNGEKLVWCHLGKAQGKYALRVDEPIDREQEFLNDMVAS